MLYIILCIYIYFQCYFSYIFICYILYFIVYYHFISYSIAPFFFKLKNSSHLSDKSWQIIYNCLAYLFSSTSLTFGRSRISHLAFLFAVELSIFLNLWSDIHYIYIYRHLYSIFVIFESTTNSSLLYQSTLIRKTFTVATSKSNNNKTLWQTLKIRYVPFITLKFGSALRNGIKKKIILISVTR